MQKQTTKEKTDAPSTKTRRRAGYLGRVTEGFDHVVLKDQNRIVRLGEDGIERTTPLSEKIHYRVGPDDRLIEPEFTPNLPLAGTHPLVGRLRVRHDRRHVSPHDSRWLY